MATRNPALWCVAGFALLAVASYGFAVCDVIVGLLREGLPYLLVDRDFANYWVAGRLVRSGQFLDLFSHDVYFAHLQMLFGSDYQIRSWSYPPHYLLLVWPLGYFDYKSAFAGFFALTLLAFIAATLIFKREFAPRADSRLLLLAVLSYVLMMLAAAQNGFVTATFLLLGLAWLRSKPLLAGIAFAFLTVKPQLGLLVPVLILFDRNWRALIAASVGTAALVGVSVLWFGVESWSAYLTDTLVYQRFVMTDWYGIFLRMMPTAFGSMRTLGFAPTVASEVQWAVTALTFVAVLWLLYREPESLRRAFVVTCATFLLTPYAFNYDMGALCVTAALLAGREKAGGDSMNSLPIALVAVCSAAVTNLGRANLPVTPLILAAGLVALWVALPRQRESRPRNANVRADAKLNASAAPAPSASAKIGV